MEDNYIASYSTVHNATFFAGEYAITEIDIDSEFMEEYEFEKVEEIEFTVSIFDRTNDYDDWIDETTAKINIEF